MLGGKDTLNLKLKNLKTAVKEWEENLFFSQTGKNKNTKRRHNNLKAYASA
jgi:hypothetical protein